MTNIRSFLNYSTVCPVCNNDKLNFKVLSSDNKLIRFIYNHLQVNLKINGFPAPKNKKSFDVSIIIDIDTGNFSIDFLNTSNQPVDFISNSKLIDCKNFLVKNFSFYKECGVCNNYLYSSDASLLFSKPTKLIFSPCLINTESTYIVGKHLDGFVKRYLIINNYSSKRTSILYDKLKMVNDDFGYMKNLSKPNKNIINVPIIKITNYESLLKRMDTIISYS